jgi:hypothetical protein
MTFSGCGNTLANQSQQEEKSLELLSEGARGPHRGRQDHRVARAGLDLSASVNSPRMGREDGTGRAARQGKIQASQMINQPSAGRLVGVRTGEIAAEFHTSTLDGSSLGSALRQVDRSIPARRRVRHRVADPPRKMPISR